ncbi:retrotransposon-related protein [Tanacetum coccineum]
MANDITALSLQNTQTANRGPQLTHSRMAKLEFPKFSGEDVKGWVFRCEQFFLLEQTSDMDKFVYGGGLPTQIAMGVRMFKPKTLADAYCLTNLQEATLNVVKKKGRSAFVLNNSRYHNASTSTFQKPLLTTPNAPTTNFNAKPNTPYVPEHKCSGQLYSLVLMLEIDNEGEFLKEDETVVDNRLVDLQALLISLNALTVVEEYEDVFAIPTELPPKRDHDHKIPLIEGGQLVNIRPYRNPPTQKDAIEGMVAELLQARVIKKSNSPSSSPIVMVKKKDNSWRMMNDADIAKTAFRTHEGHYEFLVMPFGLTNAPSTFQSLMNEVFRQYLRKFVLVFFDDVLICTQIVEDHALHLRTVLKIMRHHKLYAKRSKCVFRTNKVEYLGHVISAKGVATDPSKVEAMSQWLVPTNLKQLRGFLGLTVYYRRFIQGYASISKPLTQLLRKNTDDSQTAFEQLKQAMVRAPVLELLNFSKEFTLEIDALGIRLEQCYFKKDIQ